MTKADVIYSANRKRYRPTGLGETFGVACIKKQKQDARRIVKSLLVRKAARALEEGAAADASRC